MNIQVAKLELIKLLVETQDVLVIEKMIEILTPQKRKNEIWGYDVSGNKITDDMMIKILQKADEARKKGQLINQKELETEAENW